jgi:hypothetical protein
MITVAIPDKYAKTLSALGDVQAAVDLALQRYTIEQITAKIAQLRQRVQRSEAKYGWTIRPLRGVSRVMKHSCMRLKPRSIHSGSWTQQIGSSV